MNKPMLKRGLIATALLALTGALAAQTYYTHELARRVADTQSDAPPSSWSSPFDNRSDPWSAMERDMARMETEMDRMFDQAFVDIHSTTTGGSAQGAKVSLQERGNKYVVEAKIPGAKEGDINVSLNGRLLSISSRTQGSQRETSDKNQVIRQARYASSFEQAFTLPGPVNTAGMHTQFHDGVLTVTIPKAAS
jgi:HSP20 family protein